MSDSGNVLGTEIERLINEQFVEPAVFAQDERIVEARNQKDVMHLEGHQIFEAFKTLFRVGNEVGLGHATQVHGDIVAHVLMEMRGQV